MNNLDMAKICKIEFGAQPKKIVKKTIGLCNEVYEIKINQKSYILRMNQAKKHLLGTKKFLPLFQKLNIKTPSIIKEDYTKKNFPFYYQILSKINGRDLGLVIEKLNTRELRLLAREISDIFDKFKNIKTDGLFGEIAGDSKEKFKSWFEIILKQQKTILRRNRKTKVIDKSMLELLDAIIAKNKNYFLKIKPRLYYDDICSKNVMISKNKFNGLVDLDTLMRGDHLEAIGRIMASWQGKRYGKIYVSEIIKLQKLNTEQQNIVRVYAILNLIFWTSEEGLVFNSNTTGIVNIKSVNEKKKKILKLYSELKQK